MTLNFTKSELSKILAFLGPYITPRTPAISIRIQKAGTLEFFATSGIADGGSALVRMSCNGPVSASTWKHVDGPTLQGVISNADVGAIAFDFGETALTVKTSPRSTHELIYVLDERNEMKFLEPSATLKGKELNLIAMMTEAASTDETRPGLNGIYLAASKNKIEAAAADGYILSFTSIQAKDIESPGAVYSVKALNRAKRALKADANEDVRIGFALDGKGIVPGLVLSVGRDGAQVLLHIPKLDGSFPDYKTITKNAPKGIQLEIETSMMEKWLKRANAVEGNVFFQALNGFLWFMARNEDAGQSVDSLAINVQDESVVMHYAASLLKDTLKACAANGKIKLTFPAVSSSPMLFDGEASVIAMPLVNDLKESPFKNLQPALI
jgi:hypothetical protein